MAAGACLQTLGRELPHDVGTKSAKHVCECVLLSVKDAFHYIPHGKLELSCSWLLCA